MLLSIPMYKHQAEAVYKMHNGCILVGGVGSGKSRTALAYYILECLKIGTMSKTSVGVEQSDYEFNLDTDDIPETTLYIITTARKRDTCDWEGEAIPFGLFGIDDSKIKIVVDSWNNVHKYVGVKDSFFIFDEQRVVGYGTWSKSFIKIAKNNKWILLSATPADTWSDFIPVFIANGFYKNKSDFISRHAVFSRFTKYPKIERYVETARLYKLRKEIVVEMKFERKTQSIHKVILSNYDKELYISSMKKRWNPYTNEPMRDAAEMCRVLRTIVNTDPDKQRRLKMLFSEHPKCIVFYNFNYELDILRNVCDEIGLTRAEWNGHNHNPIPKTDKWAYLCQYTSACEGWNCTETDTTIFFSQTYSYKQMEQASGRINRVNTPFQFLYYYHMQTTSSIDRSIEYALKRKKNFNESSFVVW